MMDTIQHLIDQWLSKSVSAKRLRKRRKISALSQFCTECQTSAHCFWDINHYIWKLRRLFYKLLGQILGPYSDRSSVEVNGSVVWAKTARLGHNSSSDVEGNHTECLVTPRGMFGPQGSCWESLLCIVLLSANIRLIGLLHWLTWAQRTEVWYEFSLGAVLCRGKERSLQRERKKSTEALLCGLIS